MASHFSKPERSIRFNPAKTVKEDLVRGERLFVGLNCFEPGQSQPVHTHAGADKFYYVLSGRATVVVGEERQDVEAGSLIWAPADVAHGVSLVVEQTVMLVAIAPPPTP
ncbi:MAG: cupin domain-containing protein [Gemmatimonadota bacterium]